MTKFEGKNREWREERERRLQGMIEAGELWRIGRDMWSFARPRVMVAQRMRREREKEDIEIMLKQVIDGKRGAFLAVHPGVCVLSGCGDCKKIWQEGCRWG